MQRPRGDTQQRILDFIKNQIEEKGYPPSVREIADAVGIKSTSTVHGHLKRLEKKGLIKRDPAKPRAMTIVGDPSFIHDATAIPVLGRVAAGQPILAEEDLEEYVSLPNVMLGSGEHFILGVRGDSMIEAGILSGDYIVVHRQKTAHNGDIVVAMIDDSATVKRFFKEDGHIRLQPENATMRPIIITDCVILGKVVSSFRIIK